MLSFMTVDQDSNNDGLGDRPQAGIGTINRREVFEGLLKHKSRPLLLKIGDMVEGKILERDGTRFFLDLGPCGTGIIFGREYYAAQDILKSVKPGDALLAKVVETDNEEGYIELSLKEAGQERSWLELKKKMEAGEGLNLAVIEANRGGLILEAEGIKGFLPASQLSSQNYPRVEGGDKEKVYEALRKFIGQTLNVKILDIDPGQGKLIFSERGKGDEAVKQAILQYKIGDVVEGEITGVVDFGAFMRLTPHLLRTAKGAGLNPADAPQSAREARQSSEGEQVTANLESVRESPSIEGLIHISEIDWMLIENPREVLKPGDKVRAKIIDIQGDKVSLSLKALKEDPWTKLSGKYRKGDSLKGKVTRFNPFGAFVEIPVEGNLQVQALVHISEFGTEARMKEALELGKEYEFKVKMLDPQERRMSLALAQ